MIALVLFFFFEFVMMILWTSIFDKDIFTESTLGKVFFVSIVVIGAGGFIFALIKAQVLYVKAKKIDEIEKDTIE